MNKYAMVTINHKYDNNNNLLVRRVLISYEGKEPGDEDGCRMNYTGTRFVAKDDYFNDDTKSHQYEFYDDHYKLINVTNTMKEIEEGIGIVNSKRVYHYFVNTNQIFNWPKYADPIEFRAKTDASAIKRFNEREELR